MKSPDEPLNTLSKEVYKKKKKETSINFFYMILF